MKFLKTLKSFNKISSTQMCFTLSKNLLKIQDFQVICYWSLNTFKVLKETLEH